MTEFEQLSELEQRNPLTAAWIAWARAAGHEWMHRESGRAYSHDPVREAFFAGAAFQHTVLNPLSRTERLLSVLFSNWSLPTGIPNQEGLSATDVEVENETAQRMVRFVRADSNLGNGRA